jgi:hypothetical protein
MNKYMNKLNKKLVGGILILLLILFGVGGYFSLRVFESSKIQQLIKTTKGNEKDGSNIWEYLTKNGYRTVICKKDLFNPINVTINQGSNEGDGVFAFYTTLTRDNVFSDFKTNDYKASNGSTKFQETNLQKVANWYEQKGCDFFKQNGTIENTSFTYNPPLTPQQIIEFQKQQEQNQKTEEQVKAFNALDPQSKIEGKKKDIEKGNQILNLLETGKTTYPDGTPLEILSIKDILEKDRIPTVKALLEQIKNEVIELEKQLVKP